jgi:hypothetical protein
MAKQPVLHYVQNESDDRVDSKGALIGAGVLPITFDPNGELCFLLGREQHIVGWQGSDSWSAFEGGTKPSDIDVYHTAAREYIEESLAVLSDCDCTKDTIQKVADALRAHKYLFRITMQLTPYKRISKNMRYHVTFVVKFPYQEELVDAFAAHRNRLLQMNMSLAPQACDAACVQASYLTASFAVNPDYLEKCMIKMWRLSQIQQYLDNGVSSVNEDSFRPCFLRMARLVLRVLNERLRNPHSGAFGETA